MNKFLKMFGIMSICLAANGLLNSCGESEKGTEYNAISYENIETLKLEDAAAYHGQTVLNGVSNNGALDRGIVISPFHTLKINGKDVTVYSTRCTDSLHSFAWIDVDPNATEIKLNVSLTLVNNYTRVVCLPRKAGVVPTMEGNVVKATITSTGTFSFAFDESQDDALTLVVEKKPSFEAPEGMDVKYYDPQTYDEVINLSDNKAYYFRKGTYYIHGIQFANNNYVYFEPGTYFHIILTSDIDGVDLSQTIYANNKHDITIRGRWLVDYSKCIGGMAGHRAKGLYSFTRCQNVDFQGSISINCHSWTLCFTDCDNVTVERNMILSYRTCADGIMLSACQTGYVAHNFVRAGDDAIEAKSTGTRLSKDLVYEYNNVWNNKARCYGVIYESNHNMDNIIFRHNAIGFSTSVWSDVLGCLNVIMGTNKQVEWNNIHFEDTEIFLTKNPIVNIRLTDDVANGTDGGTSKNIYVQTVRCAWLQSYVCRIQVHNGSTLGKVYLDDIKWNVDVKSKKSGKVLDELQMSESSVSDENLFTVKHYNAGWKTNNLKINTLLGD